MPKTSSNGGTAKSAARANLFALACVLLATVARLGLEPAIGLYDHYLPFILAVMGAARYGGRGPALVTTFCSALSCVYFFLEPRYSFAVRDPAAFANLCLFVVVGVSVSFLVGHLREAVNSSRFNEERFRRLFDSMDQGFAACRLIYDAEGRAIDLHCMEVNPALLRITGMPAELVSNRPIRSVIPDLEPEWVKTFERIVRTGRSERFSLPVASLGKFFEVFAFRTGPDEFAALFEEISAKRRADEELRYLASIIQSSDDAIVGENLNGTVRSWNRGAELMFGYSAGEMIGKPIVTLAPADLRDDSEEISRRIRAGSSVQHHETMRLGKDGRRIDVSLTASPVRDEQGAVIGISRISRDISDRKRTEAQLYESEERYRALVTASSDVLYRMSADWSEMRDIEGEHLLPGTTTPGSSWLQNYVHPDDRERVRTAIAAAVCGNKRFEAEHRFSRNDGSYAWGYSRAVPLRNAKGEVVEWFGATSDISERKRAEQEIRELNAGLERRVEARTTELMDANRELEAFAYSVSHDLRAPLRAVEGFANILLRDYPGKVLDETASDYMRRMSMASRRMSNLINDLLSLSRLSRQEMRRQNVDLTAMAESILRACRDRECERHVLTDVEEGLTACADPQLMRIALENLLGNAWKYTGRTQAPEIHFGVIHGLNPATYCVRDNGAGFDMKHADQLFIPFHRLHRADEFEGNGIGLATVQRILRRHGGRIWADAKPDVGAAFYFTLGED